jgi:hypothetical protein
MKNNLKKIKSNVNHDAVKVYVDRYLTDAKSAVENLINMSRTVYELHEKIETNELDKQDESSFCFEVGLTQGGSYHRKHICIGQHANMLEKYKKQIPSAISTVYQLTVNADESEDLIKNEKIKPSTTLKELKILMNIFPKSKNKTTLKSNHFHIEFNDKKIDDTTKLKLVQIYRELEKITNIKIDFPHLSDFSANDANIIDVEMIEHETRYV